MPAKSPKTKDDIPVIMIDMGSALAPNTPARRKRRALQLTASHMWIVQHETTPAPCQLCPRGERLVTYTSINASYLNRAERDTGLRICYVCLGDMSLARENGQKDAERKLYGVRSKTSVGSKPKQNSSSSASKPTRRGRTTS